MRVDKTIITCNMCDKSLVTEYITSRSPFSNLQGKGTSWEGWRELPGNKHLCPACRADYEEVERRNQKELDEMVGTRIVELRL